MPEILGAGRLRKRPKPSVVTQAQLLSFEKGECAPSLPVVEALAFYLDIPLEQFWGTTSLSEQTQEETFQQNERLRQIRDRIIGASLRVHRTRLNFSLRELSAATSIPEEVLKKYELGEISVPLPELESLAKTFDIRVDEFFDQKSVIGKWRAQQMLVQQFLSLSPETPGFRLQAGEPTLSPARLPAQRIIRRKAAWHCRRPARDHLLTPWKKFRSLKSF